MRRTYLGLLLIFLSHIALSQQDKNYTLDWGEPIEYGLEGSKQKFQTLHFSGANYDLKGEKSLPYYYQKIEAGKGQWIAEAQLVNAVFEPLSAEEVKLIDISEIPDQVDIELINAIIQKTNVNFLKINPFRNRGGRLEKLVSFQVEFGGSPSVPFQRRKSQTFASESVLKSGQWFKIAVTGTAVYKLDYNFLSKLGLDLDNIDPRNLKLYGNGGGMLPELNSDERTDDLVENAIWVEGENDGSFDAQDYLVFYGESQVRWTWNETRQMFRHTINRYSDTTYYFINVGTNPGKRISKVAAPSSPADEIVTTYNHYDYYEKEEVNFLKSGMIWLGEVFDTKLNYDFKFDLTDVVESEPARIELSVAARSAAKSTFTSSINGFQFKTEIGVVNLNRYESTFAQFGKSFVSFTPRNGIANLSLSYDKPLSTSRGWLNFITIGCRKQLNDRQEQLFFRDVNSIDPTNVVEFRINSSNGALRVWELTDKFNIQELTVTDNASTKSILTSTSVLKEFVAFRELNDRDVYAVGEIQNQNLHAQAVADLAIVTHPNFIQQAEELANFHRSEGLEVNVATTEQIYNEFSSGAQDLVAIRSYLKMFYDRSTAEKEIKYAMLMGDASYDFKNRINGNTNFVPAYQARNSTSPIESYVSDDYFGFLDDGEGLWLVGGSDRLDLGIGRLPVKTVAEAQGVVDKITTYYSANTQQDWRNQVVFVADDEDGKIHMNQSNDLSKILNREDRTFNQKKIFLDAYPQQATANGDRYPQANVDLNDAVQNGALVVNYTGHGGETGWTSERVLSISDIISWENSSALPLFLTATCEFSRFDDPLRTSGGELLLLNPRGGGSGLYTTTRLVYSRPNYFLNATFFERGFERLAGGEPKRMGDIFREVKNAHASSSNSRNFTFLGDPALQFAIPKLNVVTTTVNGVPISTQDTLEALSKAVVEGYVADEAGNKLGSYNGLVDVIVFDKVEEKRTLNNDGNGVFSYEERANRLFKGKATVRNGDFEFSFVVPKDISYSFGKGKISYYSSNGEIDAHGYSEEFLIGGSNENSLDDQEGPEIELFMNDRSFVYGGITDENPILIAELADEQGINTVGSGIGHDLVAVIDENTQNAFILNDYYEAEVDDYSKGKITFPFTELSPGKHTLRLKAWDVANNSSEKTIEFVVSDEQDIEIDNLLNYPNPFTTNTEFIFQHNQAGMAMDVKLEIFTVSGKLVKSFHETIINDGFISRDIRWDGRDDFGDKIGKGVYVYKMKVRSRNGSSVEKIEKLVVL